MKSDLIDLAVEIRHETALAWLVHDGHRDVWIPKSQCEVEWDPPTPDGFGETSAARRGTATITLPEWLAQKTELI